MGCAAPTGWFGHRDAAGPDPDRCWPGVVTPQAELSSRQGLGWILPFNLGLHGGKQEGLGVDAVDLSSDGLHATAGEVDQTLGVLVDSLSCVQQNGLLLAHAADDLFAILHLVREENQQLLAAGSGGDVHGFTLTACRKLRNPFQLFFVSHCTLQDVQGTPIRSALGAVVGPGNPPLWGAAAQAADSCELRHGRLISGIHAKDWRSFSAPAMAPLRCHLLIGQPASGKTTLAKVLAPLLTAPGDPPAVLLSTDAIRAEVFGDAAVQGPWVEIQQRLHQRIQEAVGAGLPVIVDATHARRAWRLGITQALPLPAPVEWIGWWLYTNLPTSLTWNARRQRPVPVAVIQEMAAALADPHFGPSRAEGFAAICAVVPSHHPNLKPVLQAELAGLDRRIRAATNRERQLQRHGYSRLLDLERLLYLIKLLSTWPDLSASDPASAEELSAILSPLPRGDLADRAAAFLERLHGACYADADAIRGDLAWLEANGFCSAIPMETPIQLAPKPPGASSSAPGPLHGGLPPMGDGPVFLRVMSLLRHLLQVPFDRPAERGGNLHQHLIAATDAIPGAYLPGETASLRKDLEKLLTPYGFRNRNDNVRHGYCLGTAVLPAPRLRELHHVVRQAAGRLADPSAQQLLADLDERLGWSGISADSLPPVRSYARHAVVDTALVRRDSLAAPRRAEAIEAVIVAHRRVLLHRYSGVGSFADSPTGEMRVWPLQLIFHNVGWYLLFEDDHVGQMEGLIRSERLDRLALRGEGDLRRSSEAHQRALQRMERLLHHSGGIYFGADLEQQRVIASPSAQRRHQALETLRFRCAPWAFAFIREGLQRYPIEHTRFSRPLPGDDWWHHPKAPHVLEPGPADTSHPYPVELDLPSWTLAADIDLRSWLFAFGSGIRIESPTALRQELVKRCQDALQANSDQAAELKTKEPQSREMGARRFPNRLRQA
jgi:predicted kinase